MDSEEIDQIIELLDIEKGAKILDLCCGIDRHSLELARRGYRVVDVDLKEEYLAKERKQAESKDLNIEFVRNDMRRFCLSECFDAVINIFRLLDILRIQLRTSWFQPICITVCAKTES